MSEALTVLKTRRSCRAYKPELIEEEKRTTFTEYGRVKETVGNLVNHKQ